jgi:hypothetical protein
MGADIHLVLERKVGDRWVGMHDFPTVPQPTGERLYNKFWWGAEDRNYELFAALAGVRGDGPDPKGIPDDASDLAIYKAETYGDDGHSHSWCDAKEFVAKYIETLPSDHPMQKQWLSDLMESQNAWKLGCGELLFGYMDDDAEYRIVFFFDN